MKYKVVFVVLLLTMCIGQDKQPESEEELLPETLPPIPDGEIKELIQTYFDALNKGDISTLQKLIHPFYAGDIPPFLDYIRRNDISFELNSTSILMKEKEFRETMKSLSDVEFAQQVGRRGVSYEVELTITKEGNAYPYCFLFVEMGDTEDGWKVLDPSMFQLVVEEYLEIMESEE